MHNHGIRNPQRSALICVAVTVVAWAFVAWGALEMHMAGEETLGSGLKIGLALLPAILAPAMFYNFWRGMKVFAAIRRGENEIGRWTATAAELAEFSANDHARNALGRENLNMWTPPRRPPPQGIEIIFVADGVLVGDTYFALITTGMFKITGVRILSESLPAIAFRTGATWMHEHRVHTAVGALRIPVSRAASAAAARVLGHFERVDAREIIVNPGFYRGRMLVGLFGAPIFFAVAAVGFTLKLTGRYNDSDDVSGLLIVIGILLGGAMLVLALAAWWLGRAQRRKPRAR
ncbi:hypothetical protein [Reyranella sp. CPCC 100927]|uniref:hypothetical protein n=1 Tax=Reyranella sp. CPCC 100927 TaxID=2599616 RepID=UPI0011B6BBA2|nr:hypothetical protein [Reyranella sp. CPCC 100927]TWT15109.1 hypothetical protein FQU96_01730 [Reyranella sp. CPCC 100927]